MKLSVCLLASEVAPLSKTGGLADVTAALTQHLHEGGHDARLFTPWYRTLGPGLDAQPVQELQQLPLAVGPHHYTFSVFTTSLPGPAGIAAPVYLVDCPELYGRSTIYTTDPDEHRRFLALTRAALLCCGKMQWAPQIVHCNDWHTGFAPLFLKAQHTRDPYLSQARSVLTIHNAGYQGIFAAADQGDLGLGEHERLLYQPELERGQINALRHGILYADALTTVSPTHAAEICSDEYGMGLQDSLRARQDVLTGILNGVDYSVWDPRIDRYLPRHFDPGHLAVKAALKRELMARMQIQTDPPVPLGGIVTRLAWQKGIELLTEALPLILDQRDFAFVALGSGEPGYEQLLSELAQRYPGRVAFQRGYDDELAHWIEAACDLFVMPSLYEPSGLNQMYSLRYGTVPIVHKTGGLADTVQLWDPATREGTGIVFDRHDEPALAWALDAAVGLHADPASWRHLMANGMRQDFSWERQGTLYELLYKRMVAGG
jgi:starch synthase